MTFITGRYKLSRIGRRCINMYSFPVDVIRYLKTMDFYCKPMGEDHPIYTIAIVFGKEYFICKEDIEPTTALPEELFIL